MPDTAITASPSTPTFVPPAADLAAAAPTWTPPAGDLAAAAPFVPPQKDVNAIQAQDVMKAAPGMSTSQIQDLYNQNKDVLSPDQQEQLGQIYVDSMAPKTIGQAVQQTSGAVADTVSGLWNFLTGIGKAAYASSMPAVYEDIKARAEAGAEHPIREATTKIFGEERAGLEEAGVSLANTFRNIVLNGIQSVAEHPLAASNPIVRGLLPLLPKDLATEIGGPGLPEKPAADILNPAKILTPQNSLKRLQNDAAIQQQVKLAGSGQGWWAEAGGLDAQTLAKQGIILNPQVIDGFSQVFSQAALSAFVGLRAVSVGGKVSIVNQADRTLGTAATEDAAQNFIKGAASTVGKAADFTNKAYNTVTGGKLLHKVFGGGGVATGVLLDRAIDTVKGMVEPMMGAGSAGFTGGAGSMIFGAAHPFLWPAAIAAGMKIGIKGVQVAAKVAGSKTGSRLLAGAAKGAAAGAATAVPFAAGQPDFRSQLSTLGSMSLLGGAAGAAGAGVNTLVADIRARQIAHQEVLNSFAGAKTAQTFVGTTPGMEQHENNTQANMAQLQKGSPNQANIINTLRAALAAQGNQAYVLTPEQAGAINPVLSKMDGVSSTPLPNAKGGTQNATVWVMRNGIVGSGPHEFGHILADALQSTPEGQAEANAILDDVPQTEKNNIRDAYLNRTALTPEERIEFSAPTYINREILAEILGKYTSDTFSKEIPASLVGMTGDVIHNLMGKLGFGAKTKLAPGKAGTTESLGIQPGYTAEQIAQRVAQRWANDPIVKPAIAAIQQPPTLKAGAEPAAPITPLSPVSPAHEAVADSLGKAISGTLVAETMRKVKAGKTLSPKEQQMWENIDEGAKGQPGYYPLGEVKGQPEITPAPAPPGAKEVQPGGTSGAPATSAGKEVENIFGARPKAQSRTQEVVEEVKKAGTPEQVAVAETLAKAAKEGHAVDIEHERVVGEERGETERHAVTRVETGEDRDLVKRIGNPVKELSLTSKNRIPQVEVTSAERIVKNWRRIQDMYKATGRTLPFASDEEFGDAVRQYLENQNNGHRGGGGPLARPFAIEGVPEAKGEGVPLDKDPQVNEHKENLINMAMGEAPPKTTKNYTGGTPVQVTAAEIHRVNPGKVATPVKFENKETGKLEVKQYPRGQAITEYNPLREELRKAGQPVHELEPVSHRMNLKDIKNVTARPDLKLKPNVTRTTAAGFMPAKPAEGHPTVEVEKDGTKYKVRFDSYQNFGGFGGKPDRWVAQITPLEDIPGVMMKGSTTYADKMEAKGVKFPALPNRAEGQYMTSKNAPAISEFKDEKTLKGALEKPGWAVITGTQEKIGDHNHAENIAANERLESELKQSGADYIPVTGSYKGVDQGKNFLITGITVQKAKEFGNKYGQESVLTSEGLHYADGSLVPVIPDSTKVGAEAEKEDYYTTIPNGPSYSMGLDFDNKIPPPIPKGNYENTKSAAQPGQREGQITPQAAQASTINAKTIKAAPSARDEVTGLRSGQYMTSDNPRAIKSPAVLDTTTGEKYEGSYHGEAYEAYVRQKYPELTEQQVTHRANGIYDNPAVAHLVSGYTSNEGEFLDRDEAFERAVQMKQYSPNPTSVTDYLKRLESVSFARQNPENEHFNPIQPVKPVAPVKPEEIQPHYMTSKKEPQERTPSGWLLPDNTWSNVSLRGFHEDNIADNAREYNERFGTDFTPGNNNVGVRLDALNHGFARVRYQTNGEMHVELNQRYLKRMKQPLLDHLMENAEDAPRIVVHLLDDNGHLVDSVARSRFNPKKGEMEPLREWHGTMSDALDQLKPSAVEQGVEPSAIQRARAYPVGGEGESYMTANKKGIIGEVNPDLDVIGYRADLSKMEHADYGLGYNMTWRYNPENKTLYWWNRPKPEETGAVEKWLAKKGLVVVRHKDIGLFNKGYEEAHGGLNPEQFEAQFMTSKQAEADKPGFAKSVGNAITKANFKGDENEDRYMGGDCGSFAKGLSDWMANKGIKHDFAMVFSADEDGMKVAHVAVRTGEDQYWDYRGEPLTKLDLKLDWAPYTKYESSVEHFPTYADVLKESKEIGASLDNDPKLSKEVTSRLSGNTSPNYMTSKQAEADKPGFTKWAGNAPVVTMAKSHLYNFRTGEPVVVEALHGTTKDWTVPDIEKVYPSNYRGRGIYASNSPADVAANYAGVGPDLKFHIGMLADKFLNADKDELRNVHGLSSEHIKAIGQYGNGYNEEDIRASKEAAQDAAKEAATERLTQHKGATMKLYLRFKNPLVIGGHGESEWSYDESEGGELNKFIKALGRVGKNFNFVDPREVAGVLADEGVEDGAPISRVLELAQDALDNQGATTADGELAGPEIVRQAIAAMGYDGIIDKTVNKQFGTESGRLSVMPEMNPDTIHYVAFKPGEIKSATGNRGTYNARNPNINYMTARTGNLFGEEKKPTEYESRNMSPMPQYTLGRTENERRIAKNWSAGKYDEQVSKFNRGLDALKEGTLQKWYETNLPIDEQKSNPSEADLLGAWVDKHNLLPAAWDPLDANDKPNDTQFGKDGEVVLKTIARQWAANNANPIARLTGTSVIGSVKEKGESAHDLDLWSEKYDPKFVIPILEKMGFEHQGSQVISPKEAAQSEKVFYPGWSRVESFANNAGRRIEVWHEADSELPLDLVRKLGKKPSLPISDIKPAQQARMNLQFMTAREREEFPPAGIKTMPAIQIPGGKIFTGAFHPAAYEKAKEDNPNLNFRDVKTGWAGTDGGFYAYSRPPLSAGDIQPFRPGKLNNDMRPDLLGKNSGEAAPLPIVRHGEIENNEKKLTRGWIPAPLTKKGEAQAADAAKHLEGMGVDRIETSDLKRARQTADIIGGKLDVPVTENSGLRPWGLGPKLEGVDAKGQQHIFKELVENPDKRPPGKYPDGTLPETFNEFRHRIFSTIEKIQAENPDGGTAIVTHYRVMHALETRTKGHEVDPKAFVELGHDNPGGVSVLENGKLNHVS